MTSLYVATLAGAGRVDVDHAASVDGLRALCSELGWRIKVRRQRNFGVDHSRNWCAADMLQRSDATHLVFLDSGLVFDPKDVARMVRSELPLVGVAPPGKDIDWQRVQQMAAAGVPWQALKWVASIPMLQCDVGQLGAEPVARLLPLGTFLRVKGLSTAYMVIARETLQSMLVRYGGRFSRSADPETNEGLSSIPALFSHQRDPENDTPTGRDTGEDYAFCALWRMMGGNVHVLADAKAIQEARFAYCAQLSTLLPAARKLVWTPGDA